MFTFNRNKYDNEHLSQEFVDQIEDKFREIDEKIKKLEEK